MNLIDWKETLEQELVQLSQQGADLNELPAHLRTVSGTQAELAAKCRELYEKQGQWPIVPGYPYQEPSDWSSIQEASLFHAKQEKIDRNRLFDRIHGAWLGRAAGCLLGKPVEGWMREEIRNLLAACDGYPLRNYFTGRFPPDGLESWKHEQYAQNVIENGSGMPRDDDMDYTILALKTLEIFGSEFNTDNIAEMWLTYLPPFMTYTAERAAYLNLCAGVPVADAALLNNPYREWIGAQIRADFYGYINPGDPAEAARMAFQDAALSHKGNGIYGAMWIAAMNSAAFCLEDPEAVIRAGMDHIPQQSRLHEALDWVLRLKNEQPSWEAAGDHLLKQFAGYHRIHTINNAAIVALALLYGERDLEKTISIAVMMGLDTDCNGASAGSVIGILNGANALPDKWTRPLHDRIESFIAGEGVQTISKLALRSWAIAAERRY
ncbi:ADP-ribosylglycohydrolase family protein [Cohnella pontilimi]|uniref:ADP-ribosylglycohydrolase family protein n=1 Tax=Cohnella pontilimi TaxID=2564100 RepID=A0A4U0FHX1_9BACL|nr:ADP-ribosylglycohydrolase family protein [Cohnella pontilimi]TJY44538.1 ADP-ribosylglycohydrolase family protein [Cohnella pontilimi]